MGETKIYTKQNQEVYTAPKFIYISNVYKLWKGGACMIKEEYYTSTNPINFTQVPCIIKRGEFIIQRCIELEGAPEKYLITKGFKLKKI